MIDENLKPQYGWSVAVVLPVVPAVARWFVHLRVSANTVSVLSLVFFLIGVPLYVLDGPLNRIIAVFLFFIGTLLDVADGYVARATGTSGSFGAYLDAVVDLIRYNVFLAAMAFAVDANGLEYMGIGLYAFALNISFYRLFYNIANGSKDQPANAALSRYLPASYRQFCLDRKLLYNPFNLEDQLLLWLFTFGVLLQVEIMMLWLCLAARAFEVLMVVESKW